MDICFLDIETVPAMDAHAECKPECKYGNLKDTSKREAKLKEWETEGGQIKAMSCDPWLNKIVCIEIFASKSNGFFSFVFSACNEKDGLKFFWGLINDFDLIVGFNLINFDLQTILNRSILLEIEPTRDIPLKRYTRSPVYDIAMVLCGWDMSKLKKMDWYLKRFGLATKSGDGSQVYSWYQEGKLDKIHEYCKEDVLATKSLFEKIIKYYPIPRNYDREQYQD